MKGDERRGGGKGVRFCCGRAINSTSIGTPDRSTSFLPLPLSCRCRRRRRRVVVREGRIVTAKLTGTT